MKLTLAAASFLILCTAASAQTVGNQSAAPGGGHKGPSPACKEAIEKICPGVKPGDGRIKTCLEQHNTSFKQVCPGEGGHHGPHGKGAGGEGGNTVAPVTQPPVAQPPAGQ